VEKQIRLKGKRLLKAMSAWTLTAVEYKPQFRTIKIYETNAFQTAVLHTYYIPLPYVQFILLEEHGCSNFLYASVTNTPVKDLFKDNMFIPPLPNISTHGTVCLGSMNPKTLEEAIGLFWMMPFYNHADGEHPRWLGSQIFDDYKKLEGLNLETICQIDWPYQTDFRRFVSSSLGLWRNMIRT
jgi:hypothetical protein